MASQAWLDVSQDSGFGLSNLPYGVVSYPSSHGPHLAVAFGDFVLDLHRLAADGLLPEPTDADGIFGAATLNPLMATGRSMWSAARLRIIELLTDRSFRARVETALIPRVEVTNHLPFDVADYVDFYSSEQHARNVGAIFRPDSPELPENWKYLPIGYHGRAGTIVVSGTPVRRPLGERKPRNATEPSFGPSQRLDIEAEVGFVVGTPSTLGEQVTAAEFRDHVFGVVLVNDWSARDIQAWEYVPLGPFLGKSFATSISPWVVPLDALEHARIPLPEQHPKVFDYLSDDDPWCLDLRLEVRLNGNVVSRPPFSSQYWSPGQQLAHLTVNGASLRTGDLYASGTVTGAARDQRGSFLELSWGGAEPFTLENGEERTFLLDGDSVSISATAQGADGSTIGFSSVDGTVTPATES
ncbi:MAG TPA: fumarylacetoacetase [Actinomycetes bacterium]|nr:fumarylacetoacetase [Actinomycetes bacterium]